ncbi:MAG: hypothetical protein AAGF58_10125 [Pseudomonadota bacterium]
MRPMIAFITLIAMAAPASAAAAADYRLSLIDAGVRDYYCTFTVQLENSSAEALDDLNGYFVLLAAEEPVGETRSSSLINTSAGGTAEAVFEAPNAPCETIDGLQFVVSACRVGPSFLDQADCAANMETSAPILGAVPR